MYRYPIVVTPLTLTGINLHLILATLCSSEDAAYCSCVEFQSIRVKFLQTLHLRFLKEHSFIQPGRRLFLPCLLLRFNFFMAEAQKVGALAPQGHCHTTDATWLLVSVNMNYMGQHPLISKQHSTVKKGGYSQRDLSSNLNSNS